MEDRPRRTVRLVIHPVLFAVVAVLFVYAYNSRTHFVSPAELPLPLLVAAGGAALVWLGLALLMRSWTRSGVMVSLLLVLFFLYGRAWQSLPGAWSSVLRHGLVAGACLVLLALTGVLLGRARRPLAGLTVFLNSMALALVAFNLVLAGPAMARGIVRRPRQAAAKNQAAGQLPDIYYIVLDGYGREDVLRDYYDFDNSEFLGFLRDRGFYVADHSRPNYCQTHLSLASSLNMEYLDSLARVMGPESGDWRPLADMLLESRVAGLLRDRGYRVMAFASGSIDLKTADIFRAPRWTTSEFQDVLLATTPLPAVMAPLARKSQYDVHRERVRYALEHLADAAREDGPMFVFVHSLSPHPPFVFGPGGEPRDPGTYYNLADGSGFHHMEPGLMQEYIDGYRDQVTYVNSLVMQAVDRVLEKSDTPPVIIIQGDHGPGLKHHHDDVRWTDFNERMAILNAFYLPGQDTVGLHESISPVNSFRLVLDRLFGAGLGLLPDSSFYSTRNQPYGFVNIDTYVPDDRGVPSRVEVVVFRQTAEPPPGPDTYLRRLVARKFPGAEPGQLFITPVDSALPVEEAVRCYQQAVAAGELPSLGDEYEAYQGLDPYLCGVTALFFPEYAAPDSGAVQ